MILLYVEQLFHTHGYNNIHSCIMFVIPFFWGCFFLFTINRHDKFISTYIAACVNKIYRITAHIFTGFKLMFVCACHIRTFVYFVQLVFFRTNAVGTHTAWYVQMRGACVRQSIILFHPNCKRFVFSYLFL